MNKVPCTLIVTMPTKTLRTNLTTVFWTTFLLLRTSYHIPSVKAFGPKQIVTTRRVIAQRPLARLFSSETEDASFNVEYLRGVAVLMTVPVAWGTFEVAVRYVYALDVPVPPFLFSLAYYSVAAASLGIAALFLNAIKQSDTTLKETHGDEWPVAGGLELGGYLFGGNLLQVLGLQTVPSDRAAFLLQLTTLFVPIMSATVIPNAPKITNRTWLACLVALLGVGLMQLDDASGGGLGSFSWGIGESLVVLAAVSYTFHCIRLEPFAKDTSAIKLATCKACAETFYSAVAVALACLAADPDRSSGFFVTAGNECVQFWNYYLRNGHHHLLLDNASDSVVPALLAVAWTGLVPVAYTIAAQSYGQARVKPVTANLIYTIQPICTAVFAYLVLQERLELYGYIGGAVIGSAILLVVTENATKQGSG